MYPVISLAKPMTFNLFRFLLINRFSYPYLYCHVLKASRNYTGNPLCVEPTYQPYTEYHDINYLGYFSCYDHTCMEVLASKLSKLLNVYFVNAQTHIPLIQFSQTFWECNACTTDLLVGDLLRLTAVTIF